MGLFSFLKRRKDKRTGENQDGTAYPEITKAMFIEDQDPLENMNLQPVNPDTKGIGEIYLFLQKDYESRGYNDALTNPDESYRIDNMRLLKEDLSILIQKVSTYYEDLLKEIDFHILSRGRAGLVDLVEVLKTRKVLVEDHLTKVRQLRQEMERGDGMTQRVLLSYQRGFMRGLSAITLTEILKKEI
jgi:hypothetical protein